MGHLLETHKRLCGHGEITGIGKTELETEMSFEWRVHADYCVSF